MNSSLVEGLLISATIWKTRYSFYFYHSYSTTTCRKTSILCRFITQIKSRIKTLLLLNCWDWTMQEIFNQLCFYLHFSLLKRTDEERRRTNQLSMSFSYLWVIIREKRNSNYSWNISQYLSEFSVRKRRNHFEKKQENEQHARKALDASINRRRPCVPLLRIIDLTCASIYLTGCVRVRFLFWERGDDMIVNSKWLIIAFYLFEFSKNINNVWEYWPWHVELSRYNVYYLIIRRHEICFLLIHIHSRSFEIKHAAEVNGGVLIENLFTYKWICFRLSRDILLAVAS